MWKVYIRKIIIEKVSLKFLGWYVLIVGSHVIRGL